MTFDPNAPAFGEEAQKPADLVKEQKTEVEVKAEAVTPKEKELETPEGESKVPYSRFKKFHDEAKEAQAEVERLKTEAEEWKRKASAIEPKDEPEAPFTLEEWTEMYGDNEITRKAYQKQVQMSTALVQQAKREAAEAYKAETRAEEERVKQNLSYIDSSLEALNDFVGRDLTEAEQSSIIDIVDEYGVTFEKAYGIYGLKDQASKAPKIQSRNKVASLTNTKTQGTTSDEEAERNKNFNPLDWGAAARRLAGK